MKVFIYENPNIVNSWFNESDYKIPFLGTNLLNFNTMGFLRFASETGDSLKVFIPGHWDVPSNDYLQPYDGSSIKDNLDKYQTHDYELVFVMSAFSLLVGELDKNDIAEIKQRPEKFFNNRGVIGGLLKKGQELPSPEEFSGFNSFINLHEDNYLKLTQDLVGNLTIKSNKTEARVYGTPIILSSDISSDSTICYPSYIGKDVVINNSYVGPGSVIRGKSRISGSMVLGSFVEESIVSSAELEDTISVNSRIENVKVSRSIFPFGSVTNGSR